MAVMNAEQYLFEHQWHDDWEQRPRCEERECDRFDYEGHERACPLAQLLEQAGFDVKWYTPRTRAEPVGYVVKDIEELFTVEVD